VVAVVDAVIDVMKFWLDLGVDALRLDAVPYLCVREGTNNENLPETHDVLKRVRRALDAAYPNRMLLAEANQWPADVRAYFGDGDECHMAFHFPLMPRMFMALRQEDRHAVTEILNQTPEIPSTCQWALFLRNHDELTLEMVTDEERDYMYEAYAADPQMRLNLGIRRRLAPLMENSRRRVELLNSLLFSLPGTPVVYYGDEIGMGDNIYLGDRNGVRTPMQWSGDRNGGFSRADPARLYAPPIMDPVYGYQAINVEAQERFPFSLLNWMKRLIAMRTRHRAFGRGEMQIIYGHNRKVLSFLRRDADETILVVANLSRSVQPAELDLSAFAGLIPVEMWGLTEFPRITERPYVLTLGPYAAYWFSLQAAPLQVTHLPTRTLSPDPNAAISDSLPALLVGVDWQGILDTATRHVLERQALEPFLRRQRWFASKARQIRHARFTDWTRIRDGATPAFLAMTSVAYTDGWTDTYLLPLATAAGDKAAGLLEQRPAAVLARITGARKGAIVDGLFDDDICNILLDAVGERAERPTTRGAVRGLLAEGMEPPPERKWSRSSIDQSNSIAFVSEKYVLKLFRRIEPGPNPEFEMSSALLRQGFDRIPTLRGALVYERPGFEPGTLGLVQDWITHQGSGWDFTIDELRRFYERVAPRVRQTAAEAELASHAHAVTSKQGPPPFFAALSGWYLANAATLGRRTAELHLALAADRDPAFVPEPFDDAALRRLRDEMQAHAADVMDLLESRLDSLSEPARAAAQAVLAARRSLHDRLDLVARGATPERAGARIRVHGDYHLGQVLRTEEDFVILDFEGEPARTLEQRRAKRSPLRDVAGMIRSFSYAAHAALFASAMNTPGDYALLEPWADTWQHWVSEAFRSGYRAAAAGSPILPDDDETFETCLSAFIVEKALYELGYELNNRQDWVQVPLAGLRKLL
jgi:maltose alpha-D-glucosyltransferase/alpha-amylase